jgi:hypothetical protein
MKVDSSVSGSTSADTGLPLTSKDSATRMDVSSMTAISRWDFRGR